MFLAYDDVKDYPKLILKDEEFQIHDPESYFHGQTYRGEVNEKGIPHGFGYMHDQQRRY